ncbi:acyltransferase [Limnospira fusiformis CCALA 023]|jgi:peptidoglycan/LPS O-acetylase OafA/YrhL|uniref:Acyltransferase n=2 Tax=Sirenicapillariaceae TaxID=2934961 RepID=A0A5M3TCE2_LIMPL|nr:MULTISPECIES: acyltransferase [Arthrospira]MDF2207608.1 acyltransferase [Arthrospira platensis NCB002]BAI93136.1 putative acyltransferase [Arthrospira platensis NIES-39]TVU53782.1 MAG: acyltransferase [Arthrospira sp. PLM2.Bin9]BDT15379.1 putative acyltransferase [Arthrospira platensis NIES-39]GCE96412.1 putative acyltransferase [Arthrospira platensis NIES-46]
MANNSQEGNTKNSQRLWELDVLRGIAALSVVLFHYTSQYSTLYGHSDQVWFYWGLGRHGVEFFFIVSGFVILITLERTTSCLDFIIKRFSRLYPAYWVGIILTFTITAIAQLPELQVSFPDAVLNLTMFQWLFNVPNVDKVYWTLRIEICFYIMMLLIYKLRLLKRVEVVVSGWLALTLFYSIKTYMASRGFGFLENANYLQANNHLFMGSLIADNFDYLSMGIIGNLKSIVRELVIIKYAHLFIAGLMIYKVNKQGFSIHRFLIIMICILAQRFAYPWENSWSTTIIVASFIVLLYLGTQGYLKWLRLQPLIFLGTISYSLYLIHQNIGYALIRQLYQYGFNPNLSIILAIILSIALASAITFMIELPANQWLRLKYQEYQNKLVSST